MAVFSQIEPPVRSFRAGERGGDFIAAILALLALISLPSAAGVGIAWLFNVWGTADLFNAFYQADRAGLVAGQLGATYSIPTVVVPLLFIAHGFASAFSCNIKVNP
jgi:hypothetical protein